LNALTLAVSLYAAAAAVMALSAVVTYARRKRYTVPVLPSYSRIVYEGPVEPRDPALSARLQALGFRPSLAYRGDNMPGSPVFQTWLDGSGTTEFLLMSSVQGNYETRIISFWSLAADGSTRTTFSETSAVLFDDLANQRVGIERGTDDPRRLLAGHRARVAEDGLPLQDIAGEDLQKRALRTHEYFEYQRSRGLVHIDEAKGSYVATARIPLRALRVQLLPTAADFRRGPLVLAIAVACIVPAGLLFLPRNSPRLLLLDVVALVLAGVVAAWKFSPRVLPWSLLIAAVPLHFAEPTDYGIFAAAPLLVANLLYMRRVRKNRVLINLEAPGRKRRNLVLLWAILIALFFFFFALFRKPPS
jgi:hypothetical protein